ncbi:MAG: leucine-rich repeat domain-containing protein [Simkaniaceae bacterium]|nr:leucine-rich repeat domain-containing protein [Simkaniaceae bacterium]
METILSYPDVVSELNFSLGDLGRFAQTNKACYVAVSQFWTSLFIEITPVLERHTDWLHMPEIILDPSGEIPSSHKIQALAFSLFKYSFDLKSLPVKAEAVIAILDRVSLQIPQDLISLYSRIPNADQSILTGTIKEQAPQIRIWMEYHQTYLATIDILYLMNLGLSSIPPELEYYFPSLKILHLGGNNLTLVPDFSNFPNLEELDLAKNRFTAVPNFSNLPKLRRLHLSCNRLTTVPNFSLLSCLDTLNLNYNRLTEAPDFSHFPHLHPYLIGNQLPITPTAHQVEVGIPSAAQSLVRIVDSLRFP